MQHRRDDGEPLGEIVQQDSGWLAIDLLGRPVTGVTDLAAAESALDEAGLGYLADRYELELEDGGVERVRIVEVTASRVRVKREDWGAVDAPSMMWDLPNPVPRTLHRR